MEQITTACFLCGGTQYDILQEVDTKPIGETDYGISPDKYYRQICQCNHCRVYFNRREDLLPDDFYAGQYNAAIQAGSIAKRFARIIQFPFAKSDNKHRVLRIVNFLYRNDHAPLEMDVLDVGSGTSVFLYEMKKFGFTTHCIDPDPVAVQHAREAAGVYDGHSASFDQFQTEDRYDLITFNKVLEHVEQPAAALRRAAELLKPNGWIYLELPDGERVPPGTAMIDRSEFYIDHHTIFNRESFVFLVASADLQVHEIQQITDPSGKYTIFGFLKPS